MNERRIAKLVFRLIVGEIVERLQHQSLEDHDFIPRLASRQTLARRIAHAKLALDQRRLQLRPERFEGNHRRNRYERIILFVETFIASDQIEEAKLSHANIPRSESRSFESDLRGGWKGEFFEVPTIFTPECEVHRPSSRAERFRLVSRAVPTCPGSLPIVWT